ncbi:hypothetical protein PIB30_085292 [Stylosanthes scabra]|uniref:CCHC-type domain-containing protein n=1 Tax=Stylosanthes scabra TaxID=79078 RepID=A0ABU6QTA8_9FABA|nr:hypothetical protein [Stylosanthes scabra]
MANEVAKDGAVIQMDPVPNQGVNMNNYNLVEKIITEKQFGFGSIKAGLMGMWGNSSGVAITEVDKNTFLLSFVDHEKGRQILNREPWSFRDTWSSFLLYVNTHSSNYWQQATSTGIWLTRPNLPKVWLSFRYERIQDTYCLRCGIIGHNKRDCSRPVVAASWDPQKPRYIPGLGAIRPPPIEELEEPEARIQLDPWETDLLRYHQRQDTTSTANEQGAALSAENEGGRSTNHEVREVESQGENVFTTLFHAGESSQGIPLQELHMKEVDPPPQIPAHNMKELRKMEEEPGKSGSVNQPAANVNNGKGNAQVDEEQSQPRVEATNNGNQGCFTEEELNQMPIKEALKQVLQNKISKFVEQEIIDIWSYREKPKQRSTWFHLGRRMLVRKPPDQQYTVQFPVEEADSKEEVQGQHNEDLQQEALAHTLRHNLHIKRKKEELNQAMIIEEVENTTQEIAQQPE